VLFLIVASSFCEVYAQKKTQLKPQAKPQNKVQAPPAVSEEDDRMILAYSFYLKQKMSLDYVLVRYPSLKNYVDNTLNEWNREFIPAVKNIDSALTAHLNDRWTKNKDDLYEKYIRIDYSGIGETEARQFVDIVNDRTYGRIQSPILETFLIWHPKYISLPEKEFFDGYTSKFSTKDGKNAMPVNINVIYPRSWKAVTGNKKTKIIETFTSGFGLGDVSMSLMIEMSKANYTKENIAQLLTRESLQKGLQVNNKVLSYESNTIIDNCKAASITYSYEKVPQDLKKIYTINQHYITFYKNAKVSLLYTISSLNRDEVEIKFKKYQKLIKRITDNVVILSQWGQ
jgi:hypothetical protein